MVVVVVSVVVVDDMTFVLPFMVGLFFIPRLKTHSGCVSACLFKLTTLYKKMDNG